MVSLEKWMILTPLLKLPKNGEDWGKLIVAKGFKKLPKIQNIAQSGHTASTTGMVQFLQKRLCRQATIAAENSSWEHLDGHVRCKFGFTHLATHFFTTKRRFAFTLIVFALAIICTRWRGFCHKKVKVGSKRCQNYVLQILVICIPLAPVNWTHRPCIHWLILS